MNDENSSNSICPKIKWEKYGLIAHPPNTTYWTKTHCMVPTPSNQTNESIDILFASRDNLNRSTIGFFKFKFNEPFRKLKLESKDPLLKPGRLGSFDDNGVLPSSSIIIKNKEFLYYIGFKPGGTTRMDLFGGLAIKNDIGNNYTRYSESPILERNKINPFINTAPWVIRHKNQFYMYYVSGIEWVSKDIPRYNIQITTSIDGINWNRKKKLVAIDLIHGEDALARPYVFYDREFKVFRMWFSAKGRGLTYKNYRICYAESLDGFNWKRKEVLDEENFKSLMGIDDEICCYPIIIKNRNKYYMFYNGNNYGKDGLLLAIGQE
ncbi:hypothetical protein [Prochlorococcus sp. MIT 1223]|uniref:hypothetical protein n=1 Tax=Prochlorococcus sp. MIT 1223 TaxID=3096217 RepID=UPI002A7481C5|nr:hypothetical protein [Prochlorococcus sp. MIT 1223]